eukprot:UN25144
MSPGWYKSRSFRSRSVREPRKVLQEFGTDIDQNTEIRVYDSTADLRYMVLPKAPVGVEKLSENEIVNMVTRDHLVGVAVL